MLPAAAAVAQHVETRRFAAHETATLVVKLDDAALIERIKAETLAYAEAATAAKLTAGPWEFGS